LALLKTRITVNLVSVQNPFLFNEYLFLARDNILRQVKQSEARLSEFIVD
jgi:hypothetical protein